MNKDGTGNGLASPPHNLLAIKLRIDISVAFLPTFSSGIASLSIEGIST